MSWNTLICRGKPGSGTRLRITLLLVSAMSANRGSVVPGANRGEGAAPTLRFFCKDGGSQQSFIAEPVFLIQDFLALQENLWLTHTNNWFLQSHQAHIR